jgi:hypothetical protein
LAACWISSDSHWSDEIGPASDEEAGTQDGKVNKLAVKELVVVVEGLLNEKIWVVVLDDVAISETELDKVPVPVTSSTLDE